MYSHSILVSTKNSTNIITIAATSTNVQTESSSKIGVEVQTVVIERIVQQMATTFSALFLP